MRYQIIDKINQGGMGEIYKAKAFSGNEDSQMVALKLILPSLNYDKSVIDMFLTEAKISAMLDHPNICRIFEYGKFQERYCLAMEYINGFSLQHLMAHLYSVQRVLPFSHTAYIIHKVCEGLHYAHSKKRNGLPLNIVHRDLTPQNILMTHQGQIKIIDFGIAKADITRQKTGWGVIKGKYSYMSPEQIEGKRLDLRTDIYSLGVVLYEMLTGRRMFLTRNPLLIIRAIKELQIVNPREINPDIPEELCQIVMKALDKRRDKRFKTAREFSEALAGFLHHFFPQYSDFFFRLYLQVEIPPTLCKKGEERMTLEMVEAQNVSSQYLPIAEEVRKEEVRVKKGPPPLPRDLFDKNNEALIPTTIYNPSLADTRVESQFALT